MPLISSDFPRAAKHAAEESDRRLREAILALPEAQGEFRPLAEHLAEHHSGLDLDVIRGCLTAARQDAARAAASPPEPQPVGEGREYWGGGWAWDEDSGFTAAQPRRERDPEDCGASRLAGVGLGSRLPQKAH